MDLAMDPQNHHNGSSNTKDGTNGSGDVAEEFLDLEKELDGVVARAEPDLKDAVKRGFTNAAVLRSTSSLQADSAPIGLSDVFHVDQSGNQISLLDLRAYGCTSFHILRLSLSLNGMRLGVEVSVGAAAADDGRRGGDLLVEGVCKASCPSLQQLLPITSDGRVRVAFSGVRVEGGAGLEIRDDGFVIANTDFRLSLEEITLAVSHYVPKKHGGEEIVTSEISKDSFEKLPLVSKFSDELVYLLERELTQQLNGVLQKTMSLSEILGGNPLLMELFRTRVASVSSSGNRVVDLILMEVRKNFLQKCSEEVRLPDLKANFSKRIGLVTVHGEFETNEGRLLDLSTVDRSNDVTLSKGVSKASLVVSMKLAKMKVRFEEYKLKFMNIGPTGRIEATIWKNSIHMKIEAGVSRWRPYAVVDELKIQYFGDVDVHITGLGPLNWLVSTIRTWVSGHIKSIAIPMMEEQIKTEIQKAMDQMNVWELINK